MKTSLIIAAIAIATLSSCTKKETSLSICPEVAEEGTLLIYIDTSGASLVTDTDQAADGQLDFELPIEGL